MPPWLPRVLTRIRVQTAAGHVGFTDKASWEMQRIGLSRDDMLQVLAALTVGDDPTRLRSAIRDEWLYEFRPELPGLRLYVKVALREECVVISCHEDHEAQEETHSDE